MKRTLGHALLSVVVACGGDGEVGSDASPSADAESPDAVVDGAPGLREGQVFIGEASIPAEVSVAYAMIVDGPLIEPLAEADGCLSAPDTPGSSLAAGAIAITGTTAPITLAQERDGDVYVPTSPPPPDLFTAGETLTVTSTGATVPAFSGSVVAPVELGAVGFPAPLARSAPATMTWAAGAADFMIILIASATSTQGAILCRVPDTGSFTLSPAALALLPAAVTEVRIVTYRVEETEVAAGAWRVFLRAADGVTSDAIPFGA